MAKKLRVGDTIRGYQITKVFGPGPTLARVVTASLPQVYQLFPPAELINEIFPPPVTGEEPAGEPVAGGPS